MYSSVIGPWYFKSLSADNLCKQLGHRSSLSSCRARSGSKLFDTQMIFLKVSLAANKNSEKLPSMQRGNIVLLLYFQIQYAFHELPANVHQVGGSHMID